MLSVTCKRICVVAQRWNKWGWTGGCEGSWSQLGRVEGGGAFHFLCTDAHTISNSAACTPISPPTPSSSNPQTPTLSRDAVDRPRHIHTHTHTQNPHLLYWIYEHTKMSMCVYFVIHIIIMHFGLFLLLLHTHTRANKLTRTCKHTTRIHIHGTHPAGRL